MPDWTFDPRVGAYRDPNGQARDLAAVRRAFDLRIEASRESMRGHARDLAAGRIDAKAFEQRMRDDIRRIHVEGRVLGVGGREMATARDYGRTGAEIKKEYRYLSGFVQDIEDGRHTPAGIEARASKYAGANAIQEFEAGRLGVMVDAGYTEKRFAGPNDAVTCSTCAARLARGWVPIEEPGFTVGDSECQSSCRHQLEYRRGTARQDAQVAA